MSEPFHGVLPALITPFTEDGEAIDTRALAAIVDRLVGAGVGGLVPGGSTGEFTTLTNRERRLLVEATVEAAAGRVPVVAGTGALSTRETVELSRHAEQAGRRRGDDRPAVLRRALVARAARPLHGRRGCDRHPDHVLQPAERVRGHAHRRPVPRAARDLPEGHRRRRRRRHRAHPDRRPDAAQRLGHAHLRGARRRRPRRRLGRRVDPARASASSCTGCSIDDIDLPAARELWARLWPLCQFLEGQSYSAAVKTACGLVGDTTGPVRAPLLALDDAAVRELAALVDHATSADAAGRGAAAIGGR